LAKPAVDGLQKDLEARGVSLVRLNVRDTVGAQLARGYGVQGVPTLAVFDGAGDIVLSQLGFVDPDAALSVIDSF
jgi:thioredoxin-related protein